MLVAADGVGDHDLEFGKECACAADESVGVVGGGAVLSVGLALQEDGLYRVAEESGTLDWWYGAADMVRATEEAFVVELAAQGVCEAGKVVSVAFGGDGRRWRGFCKRSAICRMQ